MLLLYPSRLTQLRWWCNPDFWKGSVYPHDQGWRIERNRRLHFCLCSWKERGSL